MQLPSVRTSNLLAFLACAVLLAFAMYLQIFAGVKPCVLCVVQRIVFMVLGLLFLIGALANFSGKAKTLYHLFIFLIVLIGIIAATRNIWLEFLPQGSVPSCGANLTYLLKLLPVDQAIQVIFRGTGDCGKVTWRLLGLSIPMWSLMAFIGFAVFSLWQAFRRKHSYK
jgi:disulfide bond formation protein DsbB